MREEGEKYAGALFYAVTKETSRHELEITHLVFLTAWKPPRRKMRNGPILKVTNQLNYAVVI